MADNSSLFIPVTLGLSYGLMFLVAGIFLFRIICQLRAGKRRLTLRRWWRKAAAPEPGAERRAAGHGSRQCEVPKRGLQEQGCPFCCRSSSPETQIRSGKGSDDSTNVPSKAPTESVPDYTPIFVWNAETRRKIRVHTARKAMQVLLGALPKWLLLSQEQQQAIKQRYPSLPKLIKPGQIQPLRRSRMCPSLQVTGDRIADNIRKRVELKEWGDPSPSENSQCLLIPCPPPHMSSWYANRAGKAGECVSILRDQAEPRAHRRERQQCQPKVSADVPLPVSPAADKKQECLTATAALPCPANTPLQKYTNYQTDTSDLHVADIGARRRPRSAVLAVASKLQLSQKVFTKLSMHIARKCLEVKLRCFPMAVQRSTKRLQRRQRRRRRQRFPELATAFSLNSSTCHLEQDTQQQQQHEEPLTSQAASKAGESWLAPIYLHYREDTFPREKDSEVLELHAHSTKLSRRGICLNLDSLSEPAVPREEEHSSTNVTAPSEAAGEGPKGNKRWQHWWNKL